MVSKETIAKARIHDNLDAAAMLLIDSLDIAEHELGLDRSSISFSIENGKILMNQNTEGDIINE